MRRSKDETKRRILKAISEGPITFGELERKVGLSRPVLSDYLREMRNDGIITQQINATTEKRRIEYVLTPKGKGEERMLRDSLASGFQLLKSLSSKDPSAKAIAELARMAKDDPNLFEQFSRWMTDYTVLMASEETREWLRRHGEKQFRVELTKRLAPRLPRAQSDREVVITDLQVLLDVTREIVSPRRKVE
jgi:DNA-binding HxlR family transcriptional regulator